MTSIVPTTAGLDPEAGQVQSITLSPIVLRYIVKVAVPVEVVVDKVPYMVSPVFIVRDAVQLPKKAAVSSPVIRAVRVKGKFTDGLELDGDSDIANA